MTTEVSAAATGAAELSSPAVMAAELFAPTPMAAHMLAAAVIAAGMRAPSPAVTMAAAVTAPFWAGQREARQRNRENCDGNDT